MTARWHVLDINPEQWRVGPVGVGRKNGKVWAYIGPDHQLQAYQGAVRELLEDVAELTQGYVKLTLVFWRNIETEYTDSGRRRKRHVVDLTNLQKAFEDAIQDLLIENDRNVREIHSHLAEQEADISPCVAVKVEPWDGFDPSVLPDNIWMEVDFIRSPNKPRQLEIT